MIKRGCGKCERLKRKDYFFENDSVAAHFARPDFKGHSVVFLKKHKEDVSDMTEKEAHDFIDVMIKLGKAIEKTVKPDIINYQFNMNWDRHVHCHLYPRFRKDKDWGQPIKIPGRNAKLKKKELTEKEKKAIIALVKR